MSLGIRGVGGFDDRRPTTDDRGSGIGDRESARAAAAFESVLLSQLAKEMLPEQRGPHAGLITQAFADAMSAAGGLGLADQLAPALEERS